MRNVATWSRRAAAALAFSAAALLGSGPAVADPLLFGVIEVGGSDVKTAAYRLDPAQIAAELDAADDELRYSYFRAKRDAKVVIPDATTNATQKGTVPATASAVGLAATQLEAAGVTPGRIFIVLSSSVADSPEIEALRQQIVSRTSISPDVLTERQEGLLTFDWIVPPARRTNAVVVDIGSGNLKGCALASDRPRTYDCFSDATLGTKTFAQSFTPTGSFGNIVQQTAAQRRALARPKLNTIVIQHPRLREERRLYLAGGAAWVAATMGKPGNVGANWTPLTREDINRAYGYLVANQKIGADLAALGEGARTKAQKELDRANGVFTPEQALAGLEIIRALFDAAGVDGRDTDDLQARGPGSKDAIFFANVARDAWRSEYLLRKAAGRQLPQ